MGPCVSKDIEEFPDEDEPKSIERIKAEEKWRKQMMARDLKDMNYVIGRMDPYSADKDKILTLWYLTNVVFDTLHVKASDLQSVRKETLKRLHAEPYAELRRKTGAKIIEAFAV